MEACRKNEHVRRIVRNAGWLFLRLGVRTFASLLVVRLVMRGLGVSGYGTYAVVVGVASLVFFLQWSLELTVRRFLSVALESEEEGSVAITFSAGCVFSLLLCLVFALVAETVGLWFVNGRLCVDETLCSSVSAVYQLGVMSMAVNTMCMPLEALIIASERMSFFARVSLLESALAVVAALGATRFEDGRLTAYAGFQWAVSIILLSVYWRQCRCRLPSLARFVRFPLSSLKAQVLFFLKSLPSDVANIAKSDGVNLVLNVYCGSLYNATSRMASSVGTGIYGVIANFQQAAFPQLVRHWAGADRTNAEELLAFAVRWSTLLVALFVVPLVVFTHPIVSFWIGGSLPPQTEAFVRCVAVHYFFSAMTAPLHTAVLATGRIGVYQLLVAAFMVGGFVLAWGLLASGFPPWTSVGAVAFANALSFAYRLFYMKFRMNLPVGRFLLRTFLAL